MDASLTPIPSIVIGNKLRIPVINAINKISTGAIRISKSFEINMKDPYKQIIEINVIII